MIDWVKVSAVLALVGLLVMSGFACVETGESRGYARASGEWQKKEAVIAQDVQDKVAEATERAQAKEQHLQGLLDTLAGDINQEKADHEKDIARHVNAAVARTERLSVPTDCALPVTTTGAGAGTTPDPGPEARSDLLPGTAAAIFRIAGDSAQLVLDYNAVVTRYGLIRAACNAP